MNFKISFSLERTLIFGFVFSAVFSQSKAQTDPTVQTLPYSQNFSGLVWTSTTYPTGWQGWKLATSPTTTFRINSPTADIALTASGDASSTAAGVYNYNGCIGFQNTATIDASIVLAINTTSTTNITVTYDVLTLRNPYNGGTNTRINEITLQYRVGTTGNFTSLTGIEYQNNTTAQTSGTTPQNQVTKSIMLPSGCENQSTVELRWASREVSGSGSRPSFAIDNLSISSCNLSVEPTVDATSLNFSSVSCTQTTVGWTNGDGAKRIVVAKSGSAVSGSPTDQTAYTANATFASGSTISVGEYVVYNGTGTSITVSGLTTGVTYYYKVFEYNGNSSNCDENYLTSGTPLTGNQVTLSISSEPNTSASNISFSGVSSSQMTVSFTNGNGSSRLVISKAGADPTTVPTDQTTYSSSTTYGSGSSIGGGYVVYSGTGSSVTITGMSSCTTYYFRVYEFNGSACTENYYTTSYPSGNQTASPSSTSYFRSLTSGNWNDPTTWEISCDNSTWASSTITPTSNANTIEILNGHTVTITADVVLDQVVIDVGGEIYYMDTGTDSITVNDGTGTDLIINGTFRDEGPKSIGWPGSSTWSMGASGTLIRTRSTSSNNWRSNYSGGISNIPSTANWILRKNSADNPSITAVNGSYYPNLTIENNYTAAWTCSGSSSFTGFSDYPRVKGNLSIGGSGTNTVDFLDDNTNATPLLVLGNMTIVAGSSFRNNGSGVEIQGNLTVDGNLNYAGSSGRLLSFSGGNSQQISGSGSMNVYDFTINKTVNDITLSRAFTVDNTLTLTSHNIISSSTNLITMASGSSASGVSNASFVAGPIKKTGSTDFTFPVGKDAEYRPISISSLSGSETFNAEYFHADPNSSYDVSLKDGTLDHISRCEYWILNRTGVQIAVVSLSWDTYSCGVTSLPDLAVARWDGSTWRDHSNSSTTGNTSAGTVTSNGAVTSFSPFALSSTLTGVNPLPITLLRFEAKSVDDHVDLFWETASETNSNFFDIERTVDNITFTKIGSLPAAGNSNTLLDYHTLDANPMSGLSFYRLKETDFDGAQTLSGLVPVVFGREDFFVINAHFFKESDNLSLLLNCERGGVLSLQLFDVLGNCILKVQCPVDQGANDLNFHLKTPAHGVYFYQLTDGYNILSGKMLN